MCYLSWRGPNLGRLWMSSNTFSFGDVHYFYGPPEDKPPHHRFDKGSYVYLFEDVNQLRARIEIANQPGCEDQDAFDGCKTRTPPKRGATWS